MVDAYLDAPVLVPDPALLVVTLTNPEPIAVPGCVATAGAVVGVQAGRGTPSLRSWQCVWYEYSISYILLGFLFFKRVYIRVGYV